LFVLHHYQQARPNGHAEEQPGEREMLVLPSAALSVLRPE